MYLRTYEIDAFEPNNGIALEVEAGRATMGNAIYRDLIQASHMLDARFLVLAVPAEYRYKSGSRTAREPSYAKTYSFVEAIYGSPRLQLAVRGAPSDRLLGHVAQALCSARPSGPSRREGDGWQGSYSDWKRRRACRPNRRRSALLFLTGVRGTRLTWAAGRCGWLSFATTRLPNRRSWS